MPCGGSAAGRGRPAATLQRADGARRSRLPGGGIYIRGGGELASGVAWRLARCGYRLVVAEVSTPRAVRRLVCFGEAVYSGTVLIEGVPGVLVSAGEALPACVPVPVIVDPDARQLARLGPDAVIDARMLKLPPAPLPGSGWRVIGLGPGFRCQRDAVFVVETHREARLGRLIEQGEAAPDTGIPAAVAGQSSGRLLRAPAAGCLRPQRAIGDLVAIGETIGEVGGVAVRAGCDGLLRGLVHPDVELSAGEKVGDVDPRGAAVDPALISDKALAVAGGVLEGLLRLGIVPRWPPEGSRAVGTVQR